MADTWLSQRKKDPRYASERKVTPWYSAGPRFEGEQQVYNFAEYKDSAPKAKSSPKSPKKKKRKKTESGGSATASSSSASEGGTKKKKEKKGRCWTGYKPAEGVKAYAPGSCVKA